MSVSFADLGVSDALIRRLAERQITEPFPIQSASLPDALSGRDVVGKAPTGSGKTLAFGLALVGRTQKAAPRRPRGLVLVPTRELAAQVQKELGQLTSDKGRRILCIYGGTSYNFARKNLNMGVDIVVACPGRLEDMLAQRALDLSLVDTVVIDEADRMADMGFLPAVRRIVGQCAEDRHTMLFSATMGSDVRALVNEFTVDAAFHDVVGEETPPDVDHFFWNVTREGRVAATADIAEQYGRAIVFTRTKHGADRLARQLGERGIATAAIHGDRTQAQRERALRDVKSGHVDILVATDVAARGIHIDALPCVVHFDPPAQATDYLHRSGRTGRAGAEGVVVSLVSSDVEGQVNRLRKVLGIPGRSEAPESATAIRLGEVNDEAATERLDGRAPSKPARPARTSASPSRGPRPERREYTPRSESPRDERPRRDDSRAERSHVERPRGERTERREPRADRGASTGPSRGFERDRRSERPVSATKFDRDSSPSRGTDTGTVSFFNESKGYGFAVDGQGRDHFIHFSNIQGDGFRTLEAGQQVTFESATGAKGLEARNVRAVSTKPRRR